MGLIIKYKPLTHLGVVGSGADLQTTTPHGCSCSDYCRASDDGDDGFIVSFKRVIYENIKSRI